MNVKKGKLILEMILHVRDENVKPAFEQLKT
jgi:hypothetical protein